MDASATVTEAWRGDAFWAGTRAPLRRATGLDPRAYTSTEFFADEQRAVFERAWVTVATAPEVSKPGTVLVRSVGTRSILIVRDDNGVLRGFVNACRHRGTELVAADCEVGKIRCPYHRWGYALDGHLVAAPLFGEVPRDEFDPAAHGLIPVRVAAWGPLVFACLSDHTPPLDVWLGDLPARMEGYRLDGWRFQEHRTFDIAANWKLISENYQEYYHLSWVHPELAKVSRVQDHYRFQGAGMYCGQTTTPVSADSRDDWLVLPPAADLDESDAVSGRFVAIFPNVLLSVLPNHVFVMRLEPVAPGMTREECTFLLPPTTPEVSDADMAATRTFWLDVNAEDIDIVQRSQRGVSAGGAPAGPLAPRFEEPLHRFHQMLADCMTRRSLDGLDIPAGDDPASDDDRLGTPANPNPAAIDRGRTLAGH